MVRLDVRGRDGDTGKPLSIGGRLGLTLFLFFFFAMGSLFELFIIREFCRAAGQWAWARVPCKVVSSTVQERNDSESPFVFAVSYEYEYGGTTRTGSAYRRNYSGSGSYSQEQRLVQKYPAGTGTFCFVNPTNPGEVVLRRESLLIGLVVFFPLIFMVIGAGGIFLVWRKSAPEAEKPMASIALHERGKKRYGKYGLAALFAIFAAVGGGLLYPLGIRPIAKTLDARTWVETPCKVLRAEVRSHDSDDGTTYSAYVLYQYEFNGRTHQGDRFDFIGGSSSGYRGKARLVEQYRAATHPVCYVDPDNPTEAILRRGFHAKLLLALFPLPFLAVGIGGLAGVLRRSREPGPVPGLPQMDRVRRRAEPATASLRVRDTGPVTLRPQHSPGARLVGAVIVALFWNGVLSVFLVQVVEGFRHGDPSWFLTFFLIPFVLVGLGLLAMVLHQLLALFNPRPTLELSSDRIPLGGGAELRWELSGQTGRVHEFTVTLRGIEEAKYRRGTDTCTDRNTFYELELYRTSDTGQITRGQVGFLIPTDTMHSFQAPNNQVLWQLDLHGAIERWPDVKETFPITVTPRPA